MKLVNPMKRILIFTLALSLCSLKYAFAQVEFARVMHDAAKDVEEGQYEKAQTKLQLALRESSNDSEKTLAKITIASVDQAQGKGEQAVKSLLEIFEDQKIPVDLRLMAASNLSTVFMAQGNSMEGLRTLEKSATITEYPDLLFNVQQRISVIYSRLGKYDLAQKALQKVLVMKNVDPVTVVSTHIELAQLQLDLKNFKATRVEYENAISVDGKELDEFGLALFKEFKQDAKLGIANSYFQEGDYGKAKQQYTDVLTVKELTKEQRQEADDQLVAIAKATATDNAKAGPKTTP